MKRFNIAFVPAENSVSKQFEEISVSFFGDKQDGYILGENALAHITLCQFYAGSRADAISAYSACKACDVMELLVGGFRLRDGDGTHINKLWAEFLIQPTDALRALQAGCHQHLSKSKFEPLTKVETYSPHITLARLSERPLRVPDEELIPQRALPFRLVVGSSTENGVFTGVLG